MKNGRPHHRPAHIAADAYLVLTLQPELGGD